MLYAEALRCPACKAELETSESAYSCRDGHSYPVVDGIPVLIDDDRSVFRQADFTGRSETFFVAPKSKMRRAAKAVVTTLVPDILENLKAKANYRRMSELLDKAGRPKVLVLGGGTVGPGMQDFLNSPDIDFVETDVAFAPRTKLICDGHDVPFADKSFDGAVVQGVLEHVADPDRVVAEIHRVLKDDGVVYAETPFMQPGHFAPYDYRRFTPIGHRRLFRRFSGIDEGMAIGPTASMLWNIKSWVTSVTPTRNGKAIAGLLVHSLFWLRYVDRLFIDKKSVWSAGSLFFFLGRKSDQELSDRELIQLYSARA